MSKTYRDLDTFLKLVGPEDDELPLSQTSKLVAETQNLLSTPICSKDCTVSYTVKPLVILFILTDGRAVSNCNDAMCQSLNDLVKLKKRVRSLVNCGRITTFLIFIAAFSIALSNFFS